MNVRVWLLAVAGCLALSLSPGLVFAQGKAEGVVMMRLGATDVPDDVMDFLYMDLGEQIDGHPNLEVRPGGEMTLEELVVVMGCEEANRECLMSIKDMVKADRVVFGEVKGGEGTYTFNLAMFSFREGNFVGRVDNYVADASAEAVIESISALSEYLLYGNVGQLKVAVRGAEKASVFVNGERVGETPLERTDLPLGPVTVTVRSASGEERSQKMMLRRQKPESVSFELVPSKKVATIGTNPTPASVTPGVSNPWMWPAVGTLTVGVAGVAVGIISQIDLGAANDEASALVTSRGSLPLSGTVRASELQKEMDRAHTLRIVGFSVGTLGLTVGGLLLHRAMTHTAPAESPVATPLRWQIVPSTTGVRLGLQGAF